MSSVGAVVRPDVEMVVVHDLNLDNALAHTFESMYLAQYELDIV